MSLTLLSGYFGLQLQDWMIRAVLLLSILAVLWTYKQTLPKMILVAGIILGVCLLTGFVPPATILSLLNQVTI